MSTSAPDLQEMRLLALCDLFDQATIYSALQTRAISGPTMDAATERLKDAARLFAAVELAVMHDESESEDEGQN